MLENNLPDGGVRFLEPDPEPEFDQDGYQDYAEDKCFGEICENLEETLENKSELIKNYILEGQNPKNINWTALDKRLSNTTLRDLLMMLTEKAMEEQEEELITEYEENLKE
jgi:hypothetical protein